MSEPSEQPSPQDAPSTRHHPLVDEEDAAAETRPLTAGETVAQAFSLIFQLQRKRGLKRATDLLESNPGSMIVAGVLAAVLFFSFCFGAMKIALHIAGV